MSSQTPSSHSSPDNKSDDEIDFEEFLQGLSGKTPNRTTNYSSGDERINETATPTHIKQPSRSALINSNKGKIKKKDISTPDKTDEDKKINMTPTPVVSSTPPPGVPAQPAYMGDILDDIFGGSFRTPGVKASEDILLAKIITPALAFEELENIRNSPTHFLFFLW